jgi:murein DD-endopeptidase MepM/ murein hydrolase activator NlpD
VRLGRIESSGAILVSLGVGFGIMLAGWWLLHASTPDLEPAEGPRPVSAGLMASASPPLLEPPDAPRPAEIQLASAPAASAARRAEARIVEGSLRSGDTLASIFRRHGVAPQLVTRIARELAPAFSFRRARPGDRFRLALGDDGSLLSFHYRVSPREAYRVVAEGEQWIAGREELVLQHRQAQLAGIVASNLYDSILELGGTPQLASDFASIFAWDLDFNRSVHPGDEFRILYERLNRRDADGSEVFVGPGGILAAHYRNGARDYTAIYFETEEGRGGYYRPDGSSVERMFLAAPLRYRRITSSYSPARLHPILKVRRPHFGIDYAAPVGTPVWVVSDGTVIFAGRAGGFGRLVKIRHSNGYVSYYAHLSRFAKGLHVGQVVRQKQPIGYVGNSGLSTGPHVCFRIQKDGRYVNPATLRTPAGEPIPPRLLAAFKATRDTMLADLGPLPLVATDEAL